VVFRFEKGGRIVSFQKVILIGRLGKDPESREIQSGAVCNFSIATSESYNDRDGKKIERTEWHSVSVFGKLAEICAKFLTKGSQIFVEGKLQTNSWESKDGEKKFQTVVIASNVRFLDSNKKPDGPVQY
jgi:single-strand DNA-binding protein